MQTPTKRSEIISLLSEACELEHGLACSYLYAAFSMKLSVDEGDITWDQLQFVRKWAGQLYFIASEEMFHLSQAWNLLTAIGGTPYYGRPNFPQDSKYYPIGLPLTLEPFNKRSLKRFIFYELPSEVTDVDFLIEEFGVTREDLEKADTVGELYEQILAGIYSISESELFIGDPKLQVGTETCHFNEIVKVFDRESARKAIHTITEQGEGKKEDQNDCHYGLYLAIQKEFDQLEKDAKSKNMNFIPSRDIVCDPMPAFYNGQSSSRSYPITDAFTEKVSILFDNIYSLMLRILQYVFQAGELPGNEERRLSDISIQLMTRVLKPLGEALTMLPVNTEKALGCGPSFGLYRHVGFPNNINQVKLLISESISQNLETCQFLSTERPGLVQLTNATNNLTGISVQLKQILSHSE